MRNFDRVGEFLGNFLLFAVLAALVSYVLGRIAQVVLAAPLGALSLVFGNHSWWVGIKNADPTGGILVTMACGLIVVAVVVGICNLTRLWDPRMESAK